MRILFNGAPTTPEITQEHQSIHGSLGTHRASDSTPGTKESCRDEEGITQEAAWLCSFASKQGVALELWEKGGSDLGGDHKQGDKRHLLTPGCEEIMGKPYKFGKSGLSGGPEMS